MKVAILGGTGFLGSRITQHFLMAGAQVFLLNRGTRKIAGADTIECDRNKAASLSAAAKQMPELDLLIDCSSYTLEQTKLALNTLAHRVNHWVHISSAAVYSSPAQQPHSEEDAIGGAPVWQAYGHQKAEIDHFLLSTPQESRISILRPPYIYGAGNDSDRETFVWARCRRGQPIFVPGSGTLPMQFINVDDIPRLIHELHKINHCLPVEVFNIGAPSNISQLEWVEAVATAAGYRAKPLLLAEMDHKLGALQARSYFPFRDYPCHLNVDKLVKHLPNFVFSVFEDSLNALYKCTSLALLDKGSLASDTEEALLSVYNSGR
ncbi:NAD-dependent epimerase/dehydratase family protein [Bartonella sp. DGB2]|uniref:NAD-dependent epimerase/dehydratase family protein n=1 Tax=Bartonella sp. DGB2 TaxID=3388426 RepID=UPI00398F8EBA